MWFRSQAMGLSIEAVFVSLLSLLLSIGLAQNGLSMPSLSLMSGSVLVIGMSLLYLSYKGYEASWMLYEMWGELNQVGTKLNHLERRAMYSNEASSSSQQ